ncbi:hypothetical protein AVMA1855_16830 [Acidovorax sp. SUPP1855]|uniref:Arc family DNA-binding protein n=1 Tax=Acidovorax sp. SUPP1855 TaxID=431774 RepID=UPI0023DE4524|nr:Arc family DNA-binding protein [Acidovorax sp. SUPP1855]GKS85840.1 hypothetical protein AVMA1855_16830 [Acidovorax sp. SUPP1855]
MARTDPQLNFRIPFELRDRLDEAATENNRSLTRELIARLEQSFQGPELGPGALREKLMLAIALQEYRSSLLSNYPDPQRLTPNEQKEFDTVKDRITRMVWRIEEDFAAAGQPYPLRPLGRYVTVQDMKDRERSKS